MSSLTRTEARRFEKLFGMNTGYVLDFSNNRFQEFVEDSLGLNIYDSKYNRGSGSKANQLRGFWQEGSDDNVGRLLGDLLDHGTEIGAFKGEDEALVAACRQTVLRLSPLIRGNAAPNEQPVSGDRSQPLMHNVFYGPVGNIAQNSDRISQTATIGIQPHDLMRLVTELTLHLHELNLDARQAQRARAQIAALKVELGGDEHSALVKQAGRTLRNITEGAIGSLLATAAQPGVWHWISQTLASF